MAVLSAVCKAVHPGGGLQCHPDRVSALSWAGWVAWSTRFTSTQWGRTWGSTRVSITSFLGKVCHHIMEKALGSQ